MTLTEPQPAPFSARCSRCREVYETQDPYSHGLILGQLFTVAEGIVVCHACWPAISEVRAPHLEAAKQAAIDEINQYHKDNPAGQKATVLSVVDKEVH